METSSTQTDSLNKVQKEVWVKNLESMRFSRIDMNKLIMNYLATEGYMEAAEKLRQETKCVPEPALTDSLPDRVKIREAVQSGNIFEAIDHINETYPELLDDDQQLLFHLQQQHLIELIRSENVNEALEFAQTYLSERGEESPEILSELERTMSLMAFEDPAKSPYADLLELSHRQKVASEVNAAILQSANQRPVCRLGVLVKMLCWAQAELDKKNVKFPKMTDISSGVIEEPSVSSTA